jgi:long-chain fatty acid transport protein
MSLNTRSLLAALAFAGALCAGHSALGAGFQLNEMSARGTAMGNALVANPDDASAVFFNPAGMVEVPGTAVSAGVTLVRPSMDVSTLGADGWKTTENDVTWWTLPSLFSTFQLSEDFWAGIGIYVPFGLGSQFSPSWVGRYSNYDTVITSFNLNPSVAWRISDRLSVGAGLVVNFTEFQVKRKVPPMPSPPKPATLTSTSTATGTWPSAATSASATKSSTTSSGASPTAASSITT